MATRRKSKVHEPIVHYSMSIFSHPVIILFSISYLFRHILLCGYRYYIRTDRDKDSDEDLALLNK